MPRSWGAQGATLWGRAVSVVLGRGVIDSIFVQRLTGMPRIIQGGYLSGCGGTPVDIVVCHTRCQTAMVMRMVAMMCLMVTLNL